MTSKLIGRWLMALVCAVWLSGCRPAAVNQPPPQTPATVQTAPDAGLPMVPLTKKGVIVPSDVKLQPGPKAAVPPGEVTPAVASPGAN
jgi:hypothetical protein